LGSYQQEVIAGAKRSDDITTIKEYVERKELVENFEKCSQRHC
jgi:hypothetical protein